MSLPLCRVSSLGPHGLGLLRFAGSRSREQADAAGHPKSGEVSKCHTEATAPLAAWRHIARSPVVVGGQFSTQGILYFVHGPTLSYPILFASSPTRTMLAQAADDSTGTSYNV